MNLLRRPWVIESDSATPLGPSDCFLCELEPLKSGPPPRFPRSQLLEWEGHRVCLLPYPKQGTSDGPPRVDGLPKRPKTGQEPKTAADRDAMASVARMHEVLARVSDMEAALDDPERLWERLAEAWHRAQDESDPRMAEIVRQARLMPAHLRTLETGIRRVLRRTRERVPLDHIQEMDRGSMIWLARQPGRTTAERAGAGQRVLAIARHENFDTLENRVFRAYARLACSVARQWVREHSRANTSARYRTVAAYIRTCRRIDHGLDDLGVGVAEPGVASNYVLMENLDYHEVWKAWERLIRQEFREDDLWAWQAQSWIDFCVLALTLSLHGIEGSELLAQSPLLYLHEAHEGRQFVHDRPLAVFWLRRENLIIEIQPRPERVSQMQFACHAAVWLRVSDLTTNGFPRRVPVWTPHAFERLDCQESAWDALQLLTMAARVRRGEIMQEGVILMPAHGVGESAEVLRNGVRLVAIALDASGNSLRTGMAALGTFVRSFIVSSP